jgi:hypothetical protein
MEPEESVESRGQLIVCCHPMDNHGMFIRQNALVVADLMAKLLGA